MEDDIDIYEDLPNFETKECQADRELAEECSKLREENGKLKGDVAKLGTNISSLMKTAKAEIARKDKMIAQLRQELDNAAFRRGNFSARRKPNINNPRAKQSQQNAAREIQTPPLMKEEPPEQNTTREYQTLPIMKEEPLQQYTAPELDDVSDEDTPVSNDLQDKLTSTVFGARLKKKLMLEQEAARKQKEEASVAVLAIPVKVEEAENTKLSSGNDIVKKEDPEDASQDTSSVLTTKSEVPDTSSLPQSTAGSSQAKPVDGINPYHRRAPKRDLSEKRDFSANPEQHKRRRIEEDRYRREEDARQHHNGNFKYDDVRYNSEGFENNDYAKIPVKYTDPRYMDHSRGDYYRGHHQRGGRSKSTYRSNGSDPRYFDRRPDRHRMEESRIYNDKYDKQREDGWSREGDNNWTECSRKVDDPRDKFECRVGGRSEYNNYNSHNQSDWNMKRLGRKSRSPERHRSRSSGRRSREKEFDKLRSRASKSTNKFINAMSTVVERESGQELWSTHTENSKDFETAVRNNREAQPKVPPDFSRIPPNEVAADKISSEIRESCLLLCTERPGHVDTENVESLGRPLEKLVSQIETSEKDRSDSIRRSSREKESDKSLSRTSKSTDKFINAMSTVDARKSGQVHLITRAKDSKDVEVEIKTSRDIKLGVPGDSSRNSPSNEVATDKISLREITESDAIVCTKGPGHGDAGNVESLARPLEKLIREMETSEKHRSHRSRRTSREKELDKRRLKRSKSKDKFINATSTLEQRESGQERQSMAVKDSDNIKVEVKNSRDAQPGVPSDSSRNSPSNEVAADKISLIEIAKNDEILCTKAPVHVDTENAKSAGLTVEKLVSQMENPEKHRSHSSNKRSREKEFDKRRSKTSKSDVKSINAMSTVDERESGQDHQNTRAKNSKDSEAEVRNSRDAQPEIHPDCSRNDPVNELATDKISSSEIPENCLLLSTEEPAQVDTGNASSAGLPLEKLVSQIDSSEKHRSQSSRRKSTEKELDKRRSKTSKSTVKIINAMSKVDERDTDSKDFKTEVRNSSDTQPEVPPDRSRKSPPNEVPSGKISSSEIAEKGSTGCTEGPIHVNVENVELAGPPLEKLVSQIQSSEKHRSHSSTKRSKEKESDKQRSKTSKSTDKVIKVMDERESGQEHQKTRAKDSKNFEVEVKNSREAQPEVLPDCSRNTAPNDVASDKISSSEIAEKGSPRCTEGHVHVDVENAELAVLPVEKLGSQNQSSEKHRSHSSRRKSTEKESDKRRSKTSKGADKCINAMSKVDEREPGQEHQSTRATDCKDVEAEVSNSHNTQPKVPSDFSKNDPPNEAATDKVSSSETVENRVVLSMEGSGHVDKGNVESVGQPLEKLVNRVETSEKHKSHSSRRRSTDKEFDKRRSKTSKSTDKCINAMNTVDERESDQEHQNTRTKGSKDFEVVVRNSRDAQPEVPPDSSRNSPSNEVASDKISSSQIAKNGLPLSTEEPAQVDTGNAESARLPLEKPINEVETSEKPKSHSNSKRSREKEFDKKQSKTTVEEQESGQERQSTTIKDSKHFEPEVNNRRDAEPEITNDPSRNSSSNKMTIDKNSTSKIAEKGSSSVTDCPVHIDTKNAMLTVQPVEKVVNQVESSEKHGSYNSRRKSTENEFDKRRSKTSRSADKFINPMSTVDEQRPGQEPESTPAKGSEDFKAEVRNSRDDQLAVPSDSLRNRSSNEVAIDKNSSSEIAEKASPSCTTDGVVHVDNKIAESAEQPVEKLFNRVETSEKHRSHSIRRSSKEKELDNRQSSCPDKFINSMSTVDEQESVQEPQSKPATGSGDFKAEVRSSRDDQPGVPSESLRNSSPNQVAIDKISSIEIVETGSPLGTESPVHVDIKNAESAGKPVEELVNRVETSEKHRTHSIRRSSREKDVDNRQSKTSRSADKFINPTSSVDEQESGQERRSTRIKDSKDFEAEVRNTDVSQPKNPPDIPEKDPPNEAATDKVSSNEIAEKGSPLCTEEPIDVDIENTDSAGQPVESLVSQMETPDVSIADLENDSEIASIQSAIPEPAAIGSGSFREEKIENIEKFINDYKENEEPCLMISNRETDESEKLRISTSSIVDTLTMDVEESAAHQKSDNAPINPPHESKTNTKDVTGDVESTIPKSDMTIAERTSSEQIKTVCEKQISPNPETSETKPNAAKYATDKVAVVKLKKYQPRIPCVTTLSSYPRRRPSVWADSGSSSRIVKSRPSTSTGPDNKLKKKIKTRRVTMQMSSLRSIDNSTKKSDSKMSAKKQIEGTTLLTGKNSKTSNAEPLEATNAKDDSRTREDVDRKVESSENNSTSVSSSASNLPHQRTKTSPEVSDKADTAPKLNNTHESVEARETRLAVKSILAEALSGDSKSSNRKKALPKEVDSQNKPVAKLCKIVVTARRRRTMQLEDSCVATTLVPSVHDVNSNEPLKTVGVNTEGPELPNVVSEPVIKRRKRRSTSK